MIELSLIEEEMGFNDVGMMVKEMGQNVVDKIVNERLSVINNRSNHPEEEKKIAAIKDDGFSDYAISELNAYFPQFHHGRTKLCTEIREASNLLDDQKQSMTPSRRNIY